MTIPEKILEDLRNLPVLEVVERFVTLKKASSLWEACCPGHDEKTPSFKVNPTKNYWKCYGACGKGGNAIDFLMWNQHMDFMDACKWLCGEYGIELEEQRLNPAQIHANKLYALNQKAAELFGKFMSKEAKAYLHDRGYSDEYIALNQIGWGGTNNAIQKHLSEPEKLLALELGLIGKSENGYTYDRFKTRITFPIKNERNQIVGFTARIIDDSDRAKYTNSIDSVIFNKGNEFYGFGRAKNEIRKAEHAILVEGSTDADSMDMAGIKNVLGVMGTATGPKLKKLLSYTATIILLFDGDEAGIKACYANLKVCMELGLSVYCCILPDGHDPDSFIKSGNDLTAYIADNKADAIDFFLNFQVKNTTDAVEKAGKVKEIKELIGKMPDQDMAAVYYAKLSQAIEATEFVAKPEPPKSEEKTVIVEKAGEYVLGTFDLAAPHLEPYGITEETLKIFGVQVLENYTIYSEKKDREITKQPLLLFKQGKEEFIFSPNSKTKIFALNKQSVGDCVVFGEGSLAYKGGKYVAICQNPLEAMAVHVHLGFDALAIAQAPTDFLLQETLKKFDFPFYLNCPTKPSVKCAWEKSLDKKGITAINLPDIPFSEAFPNVGESILDLVERGMSAEAKNEILANLYNAFVEDAKEENVLPFDKPQPDTPSVWIDTDKFNRSYLCEMKLSYGKFQEQRTLIANFNMDSLFQVHSEERSGRVVEFKNDKGQKEVVLVDGQNLSSVNQFKKFLQTIRGTFTFFGSETAFQHYVHTAQSEEKTTVILERLGWREEYGFYAKSNAIYLPSGEILEADSAGCIELNGKVFHFPEASNFYGKHTQWRDRFSHITGSQIDFATFSKAVYGMYESSCIADILFSVACYHSAIIFKVADFFPILYLQGPASIGKSQRLKIFGALDGIPDMFDMRTQSTLAAYWDHMANKIDGITLIDEYSPDSKLNISDTLVSIFGRNTRQKKDIGGRTIGVKPESGVFITGNYGITDPATLSRLIKVNVEEKELSETFRNNEQSLEQWRKDGYSHLSAELFSFHEKFNELFAERYAKAMIRLKEVLAGKKAGEITSRLIQTNAVLLAAYSITLKTKDNPNGIEYPFGYKEVENNCIDRIIDTHHEMKAVEQNNFWEIFEQLANKSEREYGDKLIADWDYRLMDAKTDNTFVIALRLPNIYPKYKKVCLQSGGQPKDLKSLTIWLEKQAYFHSKQSNTKFTESVTVNGHTFTNESKTGSLRFDFVELVAQTSIIVPMKSMDAMTEKINKQLDETLPQRASDREIEVIDQATEFGQVKIEEPNF